MNALKDMLLGYTDAYRVTEMNLNQVGEVITDMEAKLRSTIDKKRFWISRRTMPSWQPARNTSKS